MAGERVRIKRVRESSTAGQYQSVSFSALGAAHGGPAAWYRDGFVAAENMRIAKAYISTDTTEGAQAANYWSFTVMKGATRATLAAVTSALTTVAALTTGTAREFTISSTYADTVVAAGSTVALKALAATTSSADLSAVRLTVTIHYVVEPV